MCNLLASLGAKVNFDVERREIEIETGTVIEHTAPYELVNTMRASFLVMGPLLAKKAGQGYRFPADAQSEAGL